MPLTSTERTRAHRARFPGYAAAYSAALYAVNPEKFRAKSRAWSAAHRDKRYPSRGKWQAANRELHNARCRASSKLHPETGAANAMRYLARKLQRTPLWADHVEIAKLYAAAAHNGMEVDHVIPLRGKLVSGLHVHTNMQLLTTVQNRSKGNRYAIALG